MRIIIAAGIFPPDIGGPATYASTLADYLHQKKHDVQVICYSTQVDSAIQTPYAVKRVKRGQLKTVTFVRYLIILFNLSRYADVLYAQGPIAGGLQCYLIGKIRRIPYLLKITGDYAWEQAMVNGTNPISIDDFQIIPKYQSLRIRFISFFQRFVTRSARYVIVPSLYLKKIIVGWGIVEKKIRIIYNSKPDLADTISKPRDIKTKLGINGPLVLTVGRLVSWKGFMTLIKLWPEVLNSQKAYLYIVGDGPDKLLLENAIKQSQVQSHVVLIGKQMAPSLAEYYRSADVFILNTAYEGLSHTILEAMMYGVPVAVSNKGGNPELVADGVTGLLFDYNNKNEIINTINQLLSHTTEARQYARNASTHLKKFDRSVILQQTEDLLRAVVD